MGRFTSVDPLSSYEPGWTPYRYAFNNPLKYIDPAGLMEEQTIYDFDGNAWTVECENGECGNAKKVDGNPTKKTVDTEWVDQVLDEIFHQGLGLGTRALMTVAFVLMPANSMEDNDASIWSVEKAGELEELEAKEALGNLSTKEEDRLQILRERYTQYLGVGAIAEKFNTFECMECAKDLLKFFQNAGINGEILDITTSSNKGMAGNIWSDKHQTIISTNGKHRAIRIHNTVYDNMNPFGMKYDDWIKDLHSPTGYSVTTTPF